MRKIRNKCEILKQNCKKRRNNTKQMPQTMRTFLLFQMFLVMTQVLQQTAIVWEIRLEVEN